MTNDFKLNYAACAVRSQKQRLESISGITKVPVDGPTYSARLTVKGETECCNPLFDVCTCLALVPYAVRIVL